MSEDKRTKAELLREYARRIRNAAAVSTNGGHGEDSILRRVADRLERDANALEIVQEPRTFPPMP